VLVALAGCGLRIPHSQVVAQEQLRAGAYPPGATGSDGTATGATTGTADTGTSGASGTTSSSGGSPTSGSGTTTGATGSTSTSGTGGAPKTGDTSPIVIGTTGGYSGVSNIGTVARDTLMVWARSVNQQGGINGHQVQVVAEDNASDDNRSLAAVQDLVDNKHAVAIVGLGPGTDIAPFMPYLQRKQVPVVGGFVTTGNWWNYTMAFPDGTYGPTVVHGYDATVARIAKKKNIAILYCAESPQCKDNADPAAAYAPKEGLSVKLEQAVSIAQPDFTSSCLQAKGKGVEAMLLFVDSATVKRIASSCATQGFHPIMAGLGDNTLSSNPDLQGMVTASDTFSWDDASTPALSAFQKAMSAFGPNVPLSSVAAGTWAAAEEFRAALRGATGRVTSATVLAGLWKLKNETLGGLVPGITFTKGKNATKNSCFLPVQLVNNKWRASSKRICLSL
jgi:branched-chain amino acid transport system substrate-binding protein